MNYILTLILLAAIRYWYYGVIGGIVLYLTTTFFGATELQSSLSALLMTIVLPIAIAAIVVLS